MAAVFGFGIGFQFYKKGLALVGPVATAATSVTGTSFVANWNTYDGATTYYLDVSISSSFSTFVLQNQSVSAPTTSYTVTGLTACTTYYYRVRAEGVVPTISVAPTLSPSGSQITGTVITCGTGTWNSQGSIFNYKWKRNGVAITGATSNTYTIQAIDAGTTITCDVQNQNAFGKSAYVGTSNSVSATAVDPDAQAFITAAGITDATQQQAINTLVVDYKTAGIWNKRKAIYPMVGGTATTHKYNLKDPRDLDAAFRLKFYGGLTHSSTGIQPNGANGYADTSFKPSINAFATSGGLGYYSRTNISELKIDIGSYGGGGENDIYINYTGYGTFYLWNSTGTGTAIPNTDSRGWYSLNRTNTNQQGWKNGIKVLDESKTGGVSTYNTYLFAANAVGTALYFGSKECAFAILSSDTLTDAEMLNEYNIIQSFQTTLSRNVW